MEKRAGIIVKVSESVATIEPLMLNDDFCHYSDELEQWLMVNKDAIIEVAKELLEFDQFDTAFILLRNNIIHFHYRLGQIRNDIKFSKGIITPVPCTSQPNS
jgi:hypothetical protein